MKDDLLKAKWRKFLKIRPLFSFLPFVNFVLVAGSLAFGNVSEGSDFDVILGVHSRRIFTVRGFCIALFWSLGLLQRRTDIGGHRRDRVCFSHFVTPKSYTLRPPYNDYWQALYQKLVPVYGSEAAIRKFFEANSWAGQREIFIKKEFWQSAALNSLSGLLKYTTWIFRSFFEFVLGGRLGDWVEKFVKKLQLSRIGIEKSIQRGETVYKPRLRFDDEELEFHPDTRRIEEILQGGNKN